MNIDQLQIENLRRGYQQGSFDPKTVIHMLARRAREDTHNAWIYVLSTSELDPYLDRLKGMDAASLPLYGVPFAIKDNIDLAGIPTSAACPGFTYTPTESAQVVQHLINAGAIPLGKTNLDQFATGLVGTRSPFGEGLNALNPAFISGGSSSGSAVATALAQVSFALGTDTAGSGRVPPSFNNIVGHKPSHGLISTTGLVPACRTIDCISIMAPSANDIAIVLEQCIHADPGDPFSRDNPHHNTIHNFGATPATFNFAIPEQLDFDGDKNTAALFEHAVQVLVDMGGTVHRINFEPFYAAARLLYQGPWVAERRLATSGVEADKRLPVLNTILSAESTADATFEAFYQLQSLKRICDDLVSPNDFVLTPTTPTIYTREQVAADPIDLNSRLGTYTNFMNLLDYAATAVPVGILPQGPSWGVTLFSHWCRDYRLLSFANTLQQNINLPLGASQRPLPRTTLPPPAAAFKANIDIVVCGAHLSGQPLNWQLTSRNARLVRTTQTHNDYRLYALADGKRPALIRSPGEGAAIDVEVWALPQETWGSFVDGIAEPLAIGKVQLADNTWVSGFVCANGVPDNARDITRFGGWRNWLRRKP